MTIMGGIVGMYILQCVFEECPVNISLSIIMDMRRYLVMEQSAAPMP
jgi:hypothetical protein